MAEGRSLNQTGFSRSGVKAESGYNKDLIVLFDDNGNCLRSYDPATNEVTRFHNVNFRYLLRFSAVSMDSYIYVLCYDKSVHRLNFRDKNSGFEKMRDMIGDHGWNPRVVSLSGLLFVIGGSFIEPTNVVEGLNPVANRWLRLKDKPEAVCDATLVSLNDSVFCIGGCVGSTLFGGTTGLNSFCRFTPSSSQWVNLEPMKNARHGCGAAAVGQRIFVMGGKSDEQKLNEVECYDVSLKQWTSLTPMIGCHGRSVAHRIGGSIFLVELFKNSDKVEKYDIANDRWYKVEFKGVENIINFESVSIK